MAEIKMSEFKCGECEDEVAGFFCEDCEIPFCEDCDEDSHVNGLENFRDHIRITIAEYIKKEKAKAKAQEDIGAQKNEEGSKQGGSDPKKYSADKIAQDSKNKFIGVDNAGALVLGPRYDLVTRLPLSLKNTNSLLVCGFIGPTGSGKSHFGKLFCDNEKFRQCGEPLAALKGAIQSTSSDINGFVGKVLTVVEETKEEGNKDGDDNGGEGPSSPSISLGGGDEKGKGKEKEGEKEVKKEDTNFLLLDTEGINGTDPTVAAQNKEDLAADFGKKKQKHVQFSFPRITYLFGDVVSFVYCGSPREKEKISKFLISFSEVAAAHSALVNIPLLLVVLNKVDEREMQTPKEATEKWFAKDSPAYKLRTFYEDPTAIYIPDNAYKELYEKSIQELKDLITEKLMKRFKDKKEINKLWSKAHILSEIKRGVLKMDKDPQCEFTPEEPPDVPDRYSHEKQRKQIVKYLLEQGFSYFGSRIQAYESTLRIIGRRLIDSCLLEGLPLDQLPRKMGDINYVMNENMPCTGFTNEFDVYGVGTIYCELNGPAGVHKEVHRSSKTYETGEPPTDEERENFGWTKVPPKACHWFGSYERPNIDYKLRDELEKEVKEISKIVQISDPKEKERLILDYHENVLRDVSKDMTNLYPHNTCVDCFTDNENLKVMICGHAICADNCLVSKYRPWGKEWCPLCDPYFRDNLQGLKEEPDHALNLTNLFLASLGGELGKVKTEIGKGNLTKEPKIKSGFTPFWIAIRKGYYHVAEFILKAGIVDVNSILKLNNRTVLFDLAEQKDKADAFLKQLFNDEKRIDVNVTDKDQTTLLHQASRFKNVIAAKLFLERGIKADEENKYGDTALHIAVSNKDNDMVSALAARKYPNDETKTEIYVDLDHINSKTGKGALHNAVTDINFDIVQTMLAAGANVDLQETTMNKTALYLCVEKYLGITHNEDDDLAAIVGNTGEGGAAVPPVVPGGSAPTPVVAPEGTQPQ